MNRASTLAIALGVLIGGLYTLSPLFVVFVLAMVPLIQWAAKGIAEPERRWLIRIVLLAVILRVLAIVGLFAITNHQTQAFGSFFGDEEYFVKRSWWLRNVALGIPISKADFIYAYDNYSLTSYLYVLAFLHAIFGPSPYGVHLFSVFVYVGGALMLYRLVRPSFGGTSALIGLGVLLFLPSLFAWSMSALKEPLYFALMSGIVVMSVTAVRTRSWAVRILLVCASIAFALALNTIRDFGLAMAVVSTVGGLVLCALLLRPRVGATVLLAASIALPALLSVGAVQDRIVAGIRTAAVQHWGHINTVGYVYTVLPGNFYQHRSSVNSMTLREGALYVIRSVTSYVTVPTPWTIQSQAALPFVPEQMVWYGLVAVSFVGLFVGFRRDVLLSSVLLMQVLVAAGAVALTSGNVGTLIRHRALALPYLVWFSAMGFCDLIGRFQKDAHVDHR